MNEHLDLEDALEDAIVDVTIFVNLACENLQVNGYQELCSKLAAGFNAVKRLIQETK